MGLGSTVFQAYFLCCIAMIERVIDLVFHICHIVVVPEFSSLHSATCSQIQFSRGGQMSGTSTRLPLMEETP